MGAERVGGYVLGGGASRRFGSDKALFRLPDGRTLSEHAAAALPRPLAVEPTLIVAQVSAGHLATGLRVITDEVPGLGPLGGLQRALLDASALSITLIALVACDMPWMETALLAAERDLLLARPQASACVPRLGGRWEPLHGVYRAAVCLPLVEALVARDERRMQRVVEALGALDAVATLGFEVERWARSVRSANTPDALETR